MSRRGDVIEGEINQQRSSYRQGLVLGLTMAEIMVLLVFCLLIAMATFLKSEHSRRVAAEKKASDQAVEFKRDNALAAALANNPDLAKKLEGLSGSADASAISEFWRELVDSRAAMTELERSGLTQDEIRKAIVEFKALRSKNIDLDSALRNHEIVEKINRAMTKAGQPPPSIKSIVEAIEKKGEAGVTAGHQWPPIITLSEDSGYRFAKGSAELTDDFAKTLRTQTPDQILEFIKKYQVDVIEVVGHTDEQPIAGRQSNLDRDLLPVLNNTTNVGSLIPADNAGLGLARAVSVVSVLRASEKLSPYKHKLIPLSGAQLVNTDESLVIVGTPGDIPERRRIEIRLRKSVPRETTATLPAGPIVAPPQPTPPVSGSAPVLPPPAAPPANRPVRPKQAKRPPLILTPQVSPPAPSAPRPYAAPPYVGG